MAGLKTARPDFSNYVVHFTKDSNPLSTQTGDAELDRIRKMNASERLTSILKEGRIKATTMPWTNKHAVCFTECTWGSLLFHAQRYSRFGIGFHKAHLFASGGAPAIYLPPGLMEHQKSHTGGSTLPFDPRLYAFVTPFAPPYAPRKYLEDFWAGRKPVDYSHEREWRVPHDFVFKPNEVEFVIVDKYENLAQTAKELKDAVGRDKWLLMANYERVERIWPSHQVPETPS